jgi:hypothetical protein
MPYRIQRIEEFVKQLEGGDLKLRVRVLEVKINIIISQIISPIQCLERSSNNNCIFQSERAALKATILQKATMYSVFGGTLLNLGVTLNSQGSQVIANGSFVGAGNILWEP